MPSQLMLLGCGISGSSVVPPDNAHWLWETGFTMQWEAGINIHTD